MNKPIPSKLYKYQSVSKHSLANIRNNVFFFNKPEKFNDPYDCALKLVLDEELIKDDEILRELLLKDPDFTDELRSVVLNDSNGKVLRRYRSAFTESMRTLLDHINKTVLPRIRVTCFSEKKDNTLMWSHYANSGTGFCVAFDTTCPEFDKKLLPVTYSPKTPKVDPRLINTSRKDAVQDIFYKLLSVKSVDWSYEDEWRIVSYNDGQTTTYGPAALTGVYFGSECSDADMITVAQAVKESGSSPRFFKGKRSDTKFEIEFDEIQDGFL